jgi:hypothetical protein
MKYVYGFLVLFALIFAVDLGLAHYQDYAKRRKRERQMRKWCFSAFDYGREKRL